jgi:hypothetical protein
MELASHLLYQIRCLFESCQDQVAEPKKSKLISTAYTAAERRKNKASPMEINLNVRNSMKTETSIAQLKS